MLIIDIPNRDPLELAYLVLDLNGTLSLDGQLMDGVVGRIGLLSEELDTHLLTADMRGTAAALSSHLGIGLQRLRPGHEREQKAALIQQLGPARVAAIGNGANDAGMLQIAALGIAVLGPEGLSVEALQAADIVVRYVQDALDLLIHPKRLIATWRR